MKIDIDRLHARKILRNSGKTFEMLIKALQNSDFVKGNVIVVGYSEAYALDLLDEFMRIGHAMQYTPKRITYNTVKVRAATYKFLGAQVADRVCRASGSLIFRDHYATTG